MDDSMLEEILKGQRAEGTWESEGVFTAIASKALSKLAAYQLPRPSAWVLKMVQAAVVASCTSLRIDTDADSAILTLSFYGGELANVEQLARVWTSPTATVSLAQKHLLVGLRAVSVSQKRKVALFSVDTRGSQKSLVWDGQKLSSVTGQGSLHSNDPLLVISVSDPRIVYYWERELSELRSFAVTCPIPLSVERETIGLFGMEEFVLLRKPLLTERTSNHQSDAMAWTLYRHNLTARGVISWVQHGVVCQEEEFGDKDVWQLRLFLNADHLDTDMTGLHLRFPEPFSSLQHATPALQEIFEQLLCDPEKIPKAVATLHDNESFGVWTLVTMGVLTSVTLMPFLSFFALGAGAAGASMINGLYKARQARELKRATRELRCWCERQRADSYQA